MKLNSMYPHRASVRLICTDNRRAFPSSLESQLLQQKIRNCCFIQISYFTPSLAPLLSRPPLRLPHLSRHFPTFPVSMPLAVARLCSRCLIRLMSSTTLSVAISFCTLAARYFAAAAAPGRSAPSCRRCLRSRGDVLHILPCFCKVYEKS